MLACALGSIPAARAQTYRVLHAFQCAPIDGNRPEGNLVLDSAGNLFGTTATGGAYGFGTIFEIPAGGRETVLHSFAGPPGDGETPYSGLISDTTGNMYGTTGGGGTNNYGTVFEVSANGTESVLYSFGSYPDGQNPVGGLVRDGAGNLFGTTYGGGTSGGEGTVFKVTSTGVETVLFNFAFSDQGFPNATGNYPLSSLVRDAAGNLYGTTEFGGAYGTGVVFELSKGQKETILHSFPASNSDGAYPFASVLRDAAGSLYSTTNRSGPFSGGDVFKLDTSGTETILFSFTDSPSSPSGYAPTAGLIADASGNLYGTASFGGSDGGGVVFKISPTGQETVLHSFSGPPNDGQEPLGGLVHDNRGNLYGTTYLGGASSCGTVFKLGH